jgi:hypothetical protein
MKASLCHNLHTQKFKELITRIEKEKTDEIVSTIDIDFADSFERD